MHQKTKISHIACAFYQLNPSDSHPEAVKNVQKVKPVELEHWKYFLKKYSRKFSLLSYWGLADGLSFGQAESLHEGTTRRPQWLPKICKRTQSRWLTSIQWWFPRSQAPSRAKTCWLLEATFYRSVDTLRKTQN